VTVVVLNVAGLMRQWAEWTQAGHRHAELLAKDGDFFAASLHEARGEVRVAAIGLLRDTPDPFAAAKLMHRQAINLRQPTEPMSLADYDRRCIHYIQAHAWQACAWQIDPTLPEVQPRWPD
jgi:hypothetical protein